MKLFDRVSDVFSSSEIEPSSESGERIVFANSKTDSSSFASCSRIGSYSFKDSLKLFWLFGVLFLTRDWSIKHPKFLLNYKKVTLIWWFDWIYLHRWLTSHPKQVHPSFRLSYLKSNRSNYCNYDFSFFFLFQHPVCWSARPTSQSHQRRSQPLTVFYPKCTSLCGNHYWSTTTWYFVWFTASSTRRRARQTYPPQYTTRSQSWSRLDLRAPSGRLTAKSIFLIGLASLQGSHYLTLFRWGR